MNSNKIITDGFSNPRSEALYQQNWPNEPEVAELCVRRQCGACAYYAEFNADYGLCCFAASRHFKETVFEHFTCPSQVDEGWGPHSFTTKAEHMCKCQGTPIYEVLNFICVMIGEGAKGDELLSHLRAIRKFVKEQSGKDARPGQR